MLGKDAHAEAGQTTPSGGLAGQPSSRPASGPGRPDRPRPSRRHPVRAGRPVFVAEKRGIDQGLRQPDRHDPDDLQRTSSSQVDDYWDRGLLGMALPPNFPTNPYVYVLYTYDARDRRHGADAGAMAAPRRPVPRRTGASSAAGCRACPASGDVSTGPEQVLINDWCQQFPSHSIGTVAFGPDGALYVSGGDGASFDFADYGQAGGTLAGTPTPVNPCADPANEGGALREPGHPHDAERWRLAGGNLRNNGPRRRAGRLLAAGRGVRQCRRLVGQGQPGLADRDDDPERRRCRHGRRGRHVRRRLPQRAGRCLARPRRHVHAGSVGEAERFRAIVSKGTSGYYLRLLRRQTR